MVEVCLMAALPQGGTTMVRDLLCFGTITVRTPGAFSAIVTGSGGGGVCDFEPPQALTPRTSAPPATTAPTIRLLTNAAPLSLTEWVGDTPLQIP